MELSPNIDAINKCSVSHARISEEPFAVCWLSASAAKNRDTLNFRFHHHTFFEIHLITDGRIVYDFKDTCVTVRGGEFMIVPPQCVHRVVEHSADFGKLSLAVECDVGEIYTALVSLAGQAMKLTEEMLLQLQAILCHAEGKREFREVLVRHAAHMLVYCTASLSATQNVSRKNEVVYDDRLLKAKKYIEDNYDIFFSCEEVAAHCHLSVKQLGRLFKKYEGIGLLAFLHERKLEDCKRLLLETDKNQRQIAQTLGFAGADYFNKFFVRKTELTPTQFREKYKSRL